MEINDKKILVTGGTGSFGKEFVKTILRRYDPFKVIVFSRDEQKHFEMEKEFPNESRIKFIVGDIRDKEQVSLAMKDVDIVVHAAAMKHVVLSEKNPTEAIKTNILGSLNVINAAIENSVKKVVALSTDKATNPINLYGATKLCMEKMFIAANENYEKTQFVIVRYGNVIGSKGSVIPNFYKQKEKGVMLITDPKMTRFWISMKEAISLVFDAIHEGIGGSIYIPNIPACSIEDLAKAIAPDVEHKIIGIKPGEKIHELLISSDEASNVLKFENCFIIIPFNNEYKKLYTSSIGGKQVKEGFTFSSDKTKQLSINEIKEMLKDLNYEK